MPRLHLTRAQSEFFGFLRGVAALAVMVAHGAQVFLYRLVGNRSGIGLYTGNAATLAVIFFFVISGYFISLSILRNNAQHGCFRASLFARSRIARLYPPLLFSLGLCGLVYFVVTQFHLHGALSYRFAEDAAPAAVARERVAFSWTQTIAAATFTARLFWSDIPTLNGPLWSLMWEFWYYAIALCIALAVLNRNPFGAVVGSALLAALHGASDPMAFRLYGIGLSGSVLAYADRQGFPVAWRYLFRVAGLAGAIQLLLINGPRFEGDRAKYAWAFVFVGVVAEILISPSWASALMPALRRLNCGRFSYTLYVIHFPLLLLGYSLLAPGLRLAGVATTATWSLAWMMLIVYAAAKFSTVLEPNDSIRPGVTCTRS